MDQQDKIYLYLALVTTAAFTTAIVFGILKIAEYKEPLATAAGLAM
jgi:hypothetical protein